MNRMVWVVAGITTLFHLATATIYSYHRDEFYYLASGRRLAWGYVDHPPLTPVLYRFSDAVFGHSVFALRIVPAVLHGVAVVLVALLARELGGSLRAQLIAALGTAVVAAAARHGALPRHRDVRDRGVDRDRAAPRPAAERG